MVEYVIQLRAKDEYDGLWSDWSPPEYAYSWTGNSEPCETILISSVHFLLLSENRYGLCTVESLFKKG